MSEFQIQAVKYDGGRVEWAEDAQADAYGVYQWQADGTARWVTDLPSRAAAEAFISNAHRKVWAPEHKAYVCTVCRVNVLDIPIDIASEHGTDLPAAWEDCITQQSEGVIA